MKRVRIDIHWKNKTPISVLDVQIVDLSKPETSSLDDTIRTPPLPFKNINSLTTEITDKQQPKTLPTTNKRYSRPKIFVEDIQCK